MDADNRIIPLVDDDQGEGVKDPLTFAELIDMQMSGVARIRKNEEFRKMFDCGVNKNQPEAKWAPLKDFNKRR